MLDYHSEEQLMAVGQSCRHYDSRGLAGSKFDTFDGSISCRTCKNWNGNTFVKQAFESVLNNIEQA